MAETIRGGALAGPSEYWGFHASWPLGSLTVDFDAITLKILPFTYRIEREHIRFLLESKVLWFPRLRIVHAKDGFPKVFIFWPMNFSDLAHILARHNYQVQPKDAVPQAAVESVRANYSKAIAAVSRGMGLIGVLAGLLGVWASIQADKAMAPLKEEARGYVAQVLSSGIHAVQGLGAFKALGSVDCDRVYKNFVPDSNSPRHGWRSIGKSVVAHCIAKAKFERGPAAFDLWLDKSPAGWRIYQCKLR